MPETATFLQAGELEWCPPAKSFFPKDMDATELSQILREAGPQLWVHLCPILVNATF